jgi:hypothetical protein
MATASEVGSEPRTGKDAGGGEVAVRTGRPQAIVAAGMLLILAAVAGALAIAWTALAGGVSLSLGGGAMTRIEPLVMAAWMGPLAGLAAFLAWASLAGRAWVACLIGFAAWFAAAAAILVVLGNRSGIGLALYGAVALACTIAGRGWFRERGGLR